jgi:cytochrome c biogenesis protein CcdA/glutaredoxin
MKKLFLSLALLLFFFQIAQAQEIAEPENCEQPRIQVFVREGCGFCEKEEEFIKNELSHFEADFLDIDEPQNRSVYNRVAERYELSRVTPITIVGDQIVIGFNDSIAELIRQNLENKSKFYTFEKALEEDMCISVYGRELPKCAVDQGEELCEVNPLSNIKIPFFGVVDLSKYTYTTLSVILGFVDGFNPCAMWVLVAFLIALLQIGDRFKMFVAAGVFIFAEAVMYALILTVWLSTWSFVDMDKYTSLFVGLLAIGAGVFFLYEGLYTDGTCKVVNPKQRVKISARIKELATGPMNIGFFVGLLVLAFSVNIIEFACSIGIPQTFTVIIKNAEFIKQAWYIFLYILFYVADDLIVFGIALYSVEKIGVTHKYSKASNIIGGVLMFVLGVILLFAPQILMGA